MTRSSAVLASLAERVCSVDLGACNSGDLKALSAAAVEGLGVLEGFLVQIAAAAKALEESGTGSPAVNVIRSGGALSKRRSEQIARRAEVGGLLPALGADVLSGAAAPENVDTVARHTRRRTPAERERLASLDGEISERARALPPEVFQKYFGEVIRRIADQCDEPSIGERQRAASRFSMGRRRDGMWWLKGELDGERAAELHAAVATKARELAGDQPITDNANAAALHQLATSGEGVGLRLSVGYIVDAKTLSAGPHETSLAQTWGGESIDAGSVGRLSCDADCYAVLVDELGEPGPVGRTRRRATREQRLQLRALYDCCPLDGTAFDRCEIHHVNVPWEDGGDTELDNLLPISVDWHHRIHDRGWTLKMAPDRSLKLWRPDGTLERSIPPPKPLTRRNPDPLTRCENRRGCGQW